MGKKKGKGHRKGEQDDAAWGEEETSTAVDGERCFNCSETGHTTANCPARRAKAKASRKCFVCGRRGHTRRECPGKPLQSLQPRFLSG